MLAVAALALAGGAPASGLAPPPSGERCAALAPPRTAEPVESYDARPGSVRVFAMQYEQALANVSSDSAFASSVECMIRTYVVPHLASGRPNLVAFNEDIGLATIAGGPRGAAARELFGRPGSLGCEPQGVPCGTLAALATITAAYAPQLLAYQLRFPALATISQAFVAATDTLVRSFMGSFSALARRYGIYILGSTDVAPFTQSSDAGDIAAFGDPGAGAPSSVYVATAPEVYNTAFVWGPDDVRAGGPDVLRNAIAVNRKVPLTPIERQLQFTPGPSSGPAAIENLRPFALPGSAARVGLATSLPAFTYGDPPPGVDPCSDTSLYYMRCLDRLGANVVVQDEANPGRWTGPDGDGVERWQPLSWMTSTYRAVSDPSVHFEYNVTPMLVGNLADLAFGGQSAITQRGGLAGPGCHYVGNGAFVPGEDRPELRGYAGDQRGFLALAPWVAPDGPREGLRATGAALAPGSRSPLEGAYLQTALIADLTFPPDPSRPGCNGGSGAPAAPPARARCTSARTLRFTLPAGVTSVTVRVGARRARVLRGPRRSVRVSLRGLGPGRVRVRLVVHRRGARRLVLKRVVHPCARRR